MAVSTATPTTIPSPRREPHDSRRSPGYLILVIVLLILAGSFAIGFAIMDHGNRDAKPAAGSHSQRPFATSAPTTTPPAADPTTAAVLAAYNKAYSVVLEDFLSYPVNPADPRLPEYFTGAELARYQNGMTIMGVKGQHSVGTWDLHPVVTSVNGGTAVVMDCLFDHSRIVQGLTGATVSGPDTKTTLDKVTMVLTTGTWKVSAQLQVGSGCVPAG